MSEMTPLEAWRIISANLYELYNRRWRSGHPGYTDADIEAEVICIKALQQAEKNTQDRAKTEAHDE